MQVILMVRHNLIEKFTAEFRSSFGEVVSSD